MEDSHVEPAPAGSLAPRTRSARARSKSISFISTCPGCGRQRSQNGYTRRTLAKLLETNHMIDAYCVPCDVLWPVSPEERAAISAALPQ